MHKAITCALFLVVGSAIGCAEVPGTAKPATAPETPATVEQKSGTANAAPVQQQHIDAKRAMQYVHEIVAFGRRAPGSSGMAKQQAYLRAKLKGDHLEEDSFKKKTPVGEFTFTNFIAKYPGSSDDVIVIASHYDTPYALKDFVGANDGGSSMALLLELANQFRGKKRTGPAIWLVWLDGEESVFKEWSDPDSLYGSRHLAEKWKQDGTAKRVKAFILTDMIGDADLNIDHDANSTKWLSELVYQAAANLSKKSYFYGRDTAIDDDHIPFLKAGMPAVDIIDLDYGYNNVYHHSPEDTIDKLSVNSMQIVGDVVLETVRLLSNGAHPS